MPLSLSNKTPINSGESIRYIDASSLANTTYEEKAKQLLSQFDEYSSKIDKIGNMSFEGSATIDMSQLQKLNFVTSYDKKIDKKIKVTVNQETFDLNIIVSYYQDNILLSRDTIVTQPYYIEELDDYFIDVKDERISIKETLISNSVNNCIAGVDDAVIALGVIAVLTVVTLAPQIKQFVTVVTEVVARFFTSFWNWLRGLFTTKTVTRPITTTVKVYRIAVNGKTYSLKKVTSIDDSRLKLPNIYYIALFNGEPSVPDKNVYLTCQGISRIEAIAILTSITDIPLEEGGVNKYRMHTYTLLEALAKDIAEQAAILLGLQNKVYKDNCHSKNPNGTLRQGVFFSHFHIGQKKEKTSGHSFYGLPTINL